MISLCLIIKDEEQWLKDFLNHHRSIFTEIIAVDTGSKDRSPQIARDLGAKNFDFEWTGDFSQARNFSLSQATQPWIMILDPDEIISPNHFDTFRHLIKNKHIQAYQFVTRNYSFQTTASGYKVCQGEFAELENNYPGYLESRKVRLFQNLPSIRFIGELHEMIEPSLTGPVEKSLIPIHHYGTLPEEIQRKSKTENYFQSLLQKIASLPNQWTTHFQMGLGLMESKKFEEAIKCLQKALSLKTEPVIYSHLGVALFKAGKKEEAERILQEGLQGFPDVHDLYHNLGCLYLESSRWKEAIRGFEKAISLFPKSFHAYYGLATAWMNLHQDQKAMGCFKKALELFPKFEAARVDLGIIYFSQGKKDSARAEALRVLQSWPDSKRAKSLLEMIDRPT
jgi:tetratricopeptide (TPR) repeat protein